MIKTPLLLLNYFTYNYYKEKLKKNYYKLLKNIVLHTIIKDSLRTKLIRNSIKLS